MKSGLNVVSEPAPTACENIKSELSDILTQYNN
ncbi:hypothetical protein Dtox_1578 [Desulfofarcimen acetoxidans DSM 771]|uniref:Uncharacterized protein n=1 Tax=Desulfofarcimen acetoxidans (strain ATCC 49208 / DSM 771 / KCTC 5769 / VKM B-1644 / 5575) TaxID=485916 RepID=C8VW85_DESAS|nr:hypothetical protein Dtox_1578 [Desulfofarcimen acetoxidans DSM 771]